MEHARRLPQGREKLVRVLSAAGDVILIDDVVSTLEISRTAAAQRLSRWVEQGWLTRVGRGAYVAASIDPNGSNRVLDDPWVLVPALFAPAYIGGRTAALHWGLTKQASEDVFVMTARLLRRKDEERQGVRFALKHLDEQKLFGTKIAWRYQTRVPVSDVHRTMIDMLDDPSFGGDIQHVADCLAAYLRRDDRDDGTLVDYAVRLGNGAVFKRLGFLAERLGAGEGLIGSCERHLSGGYAKLDPALRAPSVVSKWRLRMPRRWAREDQI